MCGIAGMFKLDPRDPVESEIVRRMTEAMTHRGPDDSGFFNAPGVSLGMRRLSIIDVAGGHQPVFDESSAIVLIQNGEVYNYRELRGELAGKHLFRTESDTEVIAHLFEEFGDAAIGLLNGMFAIAVYDSRRHRLTLVRDRVGKKPLYVWRNAGTVLFASEIKALLASGLVQSTVDLEAVHDFLSFNFVPLPRTILRDVRHVPPATVMTFDASGVESRRYWQIGSRAAVPPGSAQDFRALFIDAVALRLRADVPVGIFLSGGLDSSATAWAASRAHRHPVAAFSIGFDRPGFDDTSFARVVAASVGMTLHELHADDALLQELDRVTWYAEQPHGDASFIAMRELAREARRHVKVVLTGEGADEIFGGYSWHAAAPYSNTRSRNEVRAAFEANAVFTHAEKTDLYRPEMLGLSDLDSVRHIERALDDVHDADAVTQSLYVDFAILLPGNNLVKADRMGMAHSVELRCPFLDFRLIEFAFALPGSDKVAEAIGKRVVRAALANDIPRTVTVQPKRLFAVPMGDWLRADRDGRLRQMVREPTELMSTVFRIAAIERLITEHASGQENHTRKLRALLALDSWSRVFSARMAAAELVVG